MAIPAASVNDGSSDTEQPEPDYIKMFVGQIPRAMNEQDLMDMFGEFGRVYQLNLLRDKFTGVSKGKLFAHVDFVASLAVYRLYSAGVSIPLHGYICNTRSGDANASRYFSAKTGNGKSEFSFFYIFRLCANTPDDRFFGRSVFTNRVLNSFVIFE